MDENIKNYISHYKRLVKKEDYMTAGLHLTMVHVSCGYDKKMEARELSKEHRKGNYKFVISELERLFP